MAAELEADGDLLPQADVTTEHNVQAEANSGGGAKRAREEDDEDETKDEDTKRARVDESMEEKEMAGGGEGDGEKEPTATTARVGPKVFASGVAMFDYFFKLLRSWSPNHDINKYEHMMLLDLLNKGHPESAKKMGEGVRAFQVRYHPSWKSRCFFLVRVDGTSDDFSFRKCVDNILPLPEHMKGHSASDHSNPSKDNNQKGGRGGGWGRGKRGRFGR